MWISELARRVDLPVATVKYYLREGLLPPGEAVGATRSRYDEGHVRRLRLVRALTDVAGLSLDQVRQVLAAATEPGRSRHDVLGAAHARLPVAGARADGGTAPEDARAALADAVARRGWTADVDDPYLAPALAALAAMDRLGHAPSAEQLTAYVDAADAVGRADVRATAVADGSEAVERMVVGTLLLEPLLLALRRTAHRHHSAELQGPDAR